MALSPRHERFVREYLKDLNGSAAYRRVYDVKSEAVARAAAARLLATVSVKEAVAVALAAASECAWLTREYVLNGLKAEAENHSDDGSAAARVAAHKLLGQHLGMFEDTLNVNVETRLKVKYVVVPAVTDAAGEASRVEAPPAPARLPHE